MGGPATGGVGTARVRVQVHRAEAELECGWCRGVERETIVGLCLTRLEERGTARSRGGQVTTLKLTNDQMRIMFRSRFLFCFDQQEAPRSANGQ